MLNITNFYLLQGDFLEYKSGCDKKHSNKFSSECPIIKNLDVLEKKWSIKIIILISKGISRFNSIQRAIGKITPKMLSMRLKELERAGIVKRCVDNSEVVYFVAPHAGKEFECVMQKTK